MARISTLEQEFDDDLDSPDPVRSSRVTAHLPDTVPEALDDTATVPGTLSFTEGGVSSLSTISYAAVAWETGVVYAAPANSALGNEVTFISGLNPDGTLAFYSYGAWNDGTNPADYSGGYTIAYKWYADDSAKTAGTPGGAVTYAFNAASGWSTDEMATFTAGLALWSAVANISFTLTSDYAGAGIRFARGSNDKASTSYDFAPLTQGAGRSDGTEMLRMEQATISIDTSVAGFGPIDNPSLYGSYPLMTVLHEEGHALGLGHGGPYNGTKVNSQQYSAYDTRLWSLMSYFNNVSSNQYNPVYSTSWSGHYPTTPMIADILAIQRIYGAPASTALSGGQVFGFNSNITGDLRRFFDFTVNTSPVLTLWDSGGDNTLDLSGYGSASTVNLNPGTFSSFGGLSNNMAIAFDTRIDRLVGSAGVTTVTGNDNGNTIDGGGGDDVIHGGSGNDTLLGGAGADRLYGGGGVNAITGGSESDTAGYALARSAYTIALNQDGSLLVTGGGAADTLREIEYVEFADQTIAVTSLIAQAILESGTGEQQMPTVSDEATFITGIGADGKVAPNTFQSWNGGSNPANYNATESSTGKWSAATNPVVGASGGTVSYYFDPGAAWTDTEKAMFRASFALWAAEANITFVENTGASTPASQITIVRGTTGSGAFATPSLVSSMDQSTPGQIGGSQLWKIKSGTINIETGNAPGYAFGPLDGNFSTKGGSNWQTLLHEIGHILGLGHGGPYDGNIIPLTQQYSEYDSKAWTIMSYVDPSDITAKYYGTYPVTGFSWGTSPAPEGGGFTYPNTATTPMTIDILAIQRLYGAATSGPLSGGQIFGFNTNIDASIRNFFDFTVNTKPIVTLWNSGFGNTLDLSGFTQASTVNLNPGTFSSAAGLTNNIGIAFSTFIDSLVTGVGNDTIQGNARDNMITAGTGTNTIMGGPGIDTAVYAMARSVYTLSRNGIGVVTVNGNSTLDTLSSIEFLTFSDQTISASSLNAVPKRNDFNGDGKSDILWQSAGGLVEEWLMNGSAISSTPDIATAPSSLKLVGTGDFNGDGKSDILWQDANSGKVQAWLMDGSTRISAPDIATVPASTGWKIIGTGDFNGDGKSDILWQSAGGLVEEWLMNGSAISSTPDIATAPSSLKFVDTGDFNGDGKSDILWQDANSGKVQAWLMDGSTRVSAPDIATVPASTGWKIIGTGDFNGDGKSDILWQSAGGLVEEWLMNGSAISSTPDIATAPSSLKLVGTGDFNGDGKSDILWQDANSGKVQAWLMDGGTRISAPDIATVPASTGWTLVGNGGVNTAARNDFNGDGKSDILWQSAGGLVEEWLMNGSTISSTPDIATAPSSLKFVDTGDFNGDGKSDILWQDANSGKVQAWLMDGSTRVSAPDIATVPASTGWKIIGTGDFNGDGKSDILWQSAGGLVEEWLMNGSAISSTPDIATAPSSLKLVGTGDFNGDGKSDILWQDANSGKVQAWLMDGGTRISAPDIATVPDSTGWKIIGTGDFNGDGKSDILWQSAGGLVEEWLMNGSTISSTPDIATAPSSLKFVATGDFNGDGKSDILWQDANSGKVQAWLMDGGTRISAPDIATVPASTGWKILSAAGS